MINEKRSIEDLLILIEKINIIKKDLLLKYYMFLAIDLLIYSITVEEFFEIFTGALLIIVAA